MNSMSDTKFFSVPQQTVERTTETLKRVQASMASIRLGEPFLLEDGEAYHLCLAIDGLTTERLTSFKNEQIGRSPQLILSGERADSINLGNGSAISMSITAGDTAETLYALAAAHPAKVNRRPIHEQQEAASALTLLIKTACLPACLFYAGVNNPHALMARGITVVRRSDILSFDDAKVSTLAVKSEAPIPVRGGISTRMVVFQYATGENEIALIVGQPNITKELPIRIHSACATGDIFGSEKCDCGDQLRLAIEKLHEMGGGAVLYLDQEGRGIGLANKIRAYDLQNQSLDTVDANHALGFADDLRDYSAAAAMVRALGWDAVSILTNNPNKVQALREFGLNVVKRVSHQAPMNENNNHYLRTKAKRSGHMLKYK